jgi:hypothetical protein
MEILISTVGPGTVHAMAVQPHSDSTRGHGRPFRVIEKRSVGWQVCCWLDHQRTKELSPCAD